LWDTVTIAGTKLRADSSAITFSGCSNWVLDLDQDTIVFGTDSTVDISSYWVYVNGVHISNCHDMIIQGGYILHEPANATSDEPVFRSSHLANDQNRGIQIGGPSQDILIQDVREIRVRGHANLKGTHGIWISNEAHNIHIQRCRVFNDVFAYENRGYFSATCIRFEGMAMSNLVNPGDYHVWVEDCYLENNAHTAIFGEGVAWLDRDTIQIDVRNLRYLTSDGHAEHGTANGYCVQWNGDCTGARINNCVMTTGDRYKGGRGIQLERANGSYDDPIVICSTFVESHEAACVAFTGSYGYYPCAIKIRNSTRNVQVFDNQFIYIGDGSVPIGWAGYGNPYYLYGHAVIYSQITFDAVATPPYNITFENNLIRTVNRSSGGLMEAVAFDKCLSYDESFIWRNNRVESDEVGYRFGGYDGNGDYIHIVGDTLRLVDTSETDHLAWQVGFLSNRRGRGIVARDMAFENTYGDPADYDTSIAFSSGQDDNICLRQTLKVYVRGNNGLPVSGASVSVTNNYGQTVLTGSTTSGGLVQGEVTRWYESRMYSDSTDFNDFTINVSKSGDNAQDVHTVDWRNGRDTLDLPNTVGDGEWVDDPPAGDTDTTPPAPIIDLGAICDSLTGGTMLSWTATGDDGTLGRASRYDIRYSPSPITESNFTSAELLNDPPSPRPSGQPESFLVTLPPDHTIYYFSIRAYDDVNLGSGLDDPTEYAPGNIRAPTVDTVYVDEANRLVTLIVEPAQSCEETYYEFQIDITDAFPAPSTLVDSVPDTFARATFAGLLDNTVYYWRCRAVLPEGFGTSEFTAIQALMPFVTFGTGCTDVVAVSPPDGDAFNTTTPDLTVQNIDDEIRNVYFFELDTDTGFDNLVASGVVGQQGGANTTWTLPVELEKGRLYYWRARVNNCPFGLTSSFLVAHQESYAFPNPSNPQAGDPVTFAGIPANSNLTIMTVSGSVVSYWESTTGEDIFWTGSNSSGNPVASGVYMWFVEPGGAKGKIIVVR
jgi:hypothetical protein